LDSQTDSPKFESLDCFFLGGSMLNAFNYTEDQYTN